MLQVLYLWLLSFSKSKTAKVVVFASVIVAMVLSLALVPATTYAAPSADQPIELDNGAFSTSKPTFKLIAVGWTIGCKKNTRNLDYKFKLDFGSRFPASFNIDQFRVKTWNSKVEEALRNSGGNIMGYDLHDRNNAYVCVGIRVMSAGGSSQSMSVYVK
jgi:hypothetical protein